MAGIVRLTQDVLEILAQSAAPSVRVTQDVLEILAAGGSPEVRVTQDVLEILYTAEVVPIVLVSQDVLEVLYSEEQPAVEGCFLARLATAGVKVGALVSPGVEAGRVG